MKAMKSAGGYTLAEILHQLIPQPEIIEPDEPETHQQHTTQEPDPHGQEPNANALMVLLDATIAAHQQTIDILRDDVQHLRDEIALSHAQRTVDAATIAQLRSEIERLKRPWFLRFR